MSSLNRYLVISFIFLLIILKIEVKAASEAVVFVSPEATVVGEQITLGDIAEIITDDVELKHRLQSISLGLSPFLGVTRELPKDKIILGITAAGVSQNDINLESPLVVKIQRASRIVDYEFLKAAVDAAALNEIRKTGVIAQLIRLDLPQVIEIPIGEAEIRAYVNGVKDVLTPFTAFIELWVGGKIVKRLSVTTQAEAYGFVWIATRNVSAGERLRETDGQMQTVRLKYPISRYLVNPKKLQGIAVRRAIPSGEPVMIGDLFADRVIKAGDMVRIIGKGGNMVVEVTGEARGAGRIGDRIQIKNLQSGILLQGIIKDDGLVQVYF